MDLKTSINNNQFKNVFELLLEEKVAIINDVSDDLKCGICKKVLINAYQTNCGCKFCKKCIDDYKNDGGQFCPGNTEYCHFKNISTITSDFITNQQISQLTVRCNNKDCHFECNLMELGSHLDTCLKRELNCPFEIVGCEEKGIEDKINNHLQVNNFIHSKLLLDTINDLRTEVKELKDNEKVNNKEILYLRQKLEDQLEETKIIREYADMMKMEIENRRNEMLHSEIGNVELINDEPEERFESMSQSIKPMEIEIDYNEPKLTDLTDSIEITSIKDPNEHENTWNTSIQSIFTTSLNRIMAKKSYMSNSVSKEFELNKNEVQNVRNEIKEVTGEISTDIASLKKEIARAKMEMQMTVSRLEKQMDLGEKTFVWHMDRVDKLEFGRPYYSGSFRNRDQLYKMGLRLYRWRDGDLSVCLIIYRGSSDDDLEWPFKTSVTISIDNNNFNQIKYKSITQSVVIDQPSDEMLRHQSSDRFLFKKSDLLNFDLKYPFVVECTIDDKKQAE